MTRAAANRPWVCEVRWVLAVAARNVAVGRQLGRSVVRPRVGAQSRFVERGRTVKTTARVTGAKQESHSGPTTCAAMLMRTPLPLEHFVVVEPSAVATDGFILLISERMR